MLAVKEGGVGEGTRKDGGCARKRMTTIERERERERELFIDPGRNTHSATPTRAGRTAPFRRGVHGLAQSRPGVRLRSVFAG
jgi:hypothetical protein